MAIPKIVHQTAPTKQLTAEEARLRQRAQRLLPSWTFRLWDDEENAALMAREFPQYADRFNQIRRGVVKADIARYAYMQAHGGVYFDTDYKVLRTWSEAWLENRCILATSQGEDNGGEDFRVCNSIFAAERGYPLWSDFVTHLFETVDVEELAENQVEKTTGPEGLTNFFLRRRARYDGLWVAPRRQFLPLITAKGFSYDRSFPSFGAHLCWGSWRSLPPLRAAKAVCVRKLTSFG